MDLARLSDTNPHVYICAAHPAIFACLFHQTCFATALFLPHQLSFRNDILRPGSLDSGHWARCLDIWRYFRSREAYIENIDSRDSYNIKLRSANGKGLNKNKCYCTKGSLQLWNAKRPRYSKYYTKIGPLCVELIKAAPARLEGQQLLVLFAFIE